MKHRFYNRIILIVTLILCSFSCSSNLDFNQVNDFSMQPVFTTNLAYFEAKAPQFVVGGVEQSFFGYIANVDFLNTTLAQNNLVKSDLYFRIKNTIAREYNYKITFLDKNNAPIYNIAINVPAYSGTEVLVEKTEIFTTANIAILKNTKKMVFSVAMLPGPPLTVDSPGRVELSSSLTAYFDVK